MQHLLFPSVFSISGKAKSLTECTKRWGDIGGRRVGNGLKTLYVASAGHVLLDGGQLGGADGNLAARKLAFNLGRLANAAPEQRWAVAANRRDDDEPWVRGERMVVPFL